MDDKILPPIISGVAVLIGVVVGGILSRWTTYSLEKRRWQREDARRFEADRRISYVKLLSVVNHLIFLEESVEKMPADLKVEFTNALAEIEVLASPEIRKRAFMFGQIVSDQIFNRVKSSYPMDAWGNSRKALIEAIHKELGIDVLDEED